MLREGGGPGVPARNPLFRAVPHARASLEGDRHMSLPIRRSLAVAALAVLPATAWAFHNHLVKSAPLTGETVSSPKAITLWFAEKPELAFSSIELSGADAATVPLGKVAPVAGDSLAIAAPVTGALKPGAYTVNWKTAGKDGHQIRGKFGFTVK